jgi:hypothetical protein
VLPIGACRGAKPLCVLPLPPRLGVRGLKAALHKRVGGPSLLEEVQ